jgi:hypothetical protein
VEIGGEGYLIPGVYDSSAPGSIDMPEDEALLIAAAILLAKTLGTEIRAARSDEVRTAVENAEALRNTARENAQRRESKRSEQRRKREN